MVVEDNYTFKLKDESGGEKYGAVRKIGEGGMGEVFEGHGLGKHNRNVRVAIKKIHHDMAPDVEFQKRFFDELNTTHVLNHANIVAIRDGLHTDDSGNYYMILEYIDGLTLRKFVELYASRNKKIPYDVSLFIEQEICKGLHYAHTATDAKGNHLNIVHRDISLNNIMLSYHGNVKIIDFGIARKTHEHRFSEKTRFGAIGKQNYMSPEQLRGDVVDARSDIYSAAVVAFELFTGEALTRRLRCPDDLSRIEDRTLRKILHSALRQEAKKRFKTAREMQSALRNCYALFMQRNKIFLPFPEENLKSALDVILPQEERSDEKTIVKSRKTEVIKTRLVRFEIPAEETQVTSKFERAFDTLSKGTKRAGKAIHDGILSRKKALLKKTGEVRAKLRSFSENFKKTQTWRHLRQFGGIYCTLVLIAPALIAGVSSDFEGSIYEIRTNDPANVTIDGAAYGPTPIRFRADARLEKPDIRLLRDGYPEILVRLDQFTDNRFVYEYGSLSRKILTIRTNLQTPIFIFDHQEITTQNGVFVQPFEDDMMTVEIIGPDSLSSGVLSVWEEADSLIVTNRSPVGKWALEKNTMDSLKISVTFHRKQVIRSKPVSTVVAQYETHRDTLGLADGSAYFFPIGERLSLELLKAGYEPFTRNLTVSEDGVSRPIYVLLDRFVTIIATDIAGNLLVFEVIQKKRNGRTRMNLHQSSLSVDQFTAYLRGEIALTRNKPKRMSVVDGDELTITFPGYFYEPFTIRPGKFEYRTVMTKASYGNMFAVYDRQSRKMIIGGTIFWKESSSRNAWEKKPVKGMGTRLQLEPGVAYKVGYEGEKGSRYTRATFVGEIVQEKDGSLKHILPKKWQNPDSPFRIINDAPKIGGKWFLFQVEKK